MFYMPCILFSLIRPHKAQENLVSWSLQNYQRIIVKKVFYTVKNSWVWDFSLHTHKQFCILKRQLKVLKILLGFHTINKEQPSLFSCDHIMKLLKTKQVQKALDLPFLWFIYFKSWGDIFNLGHRNSIFGFSAAAAYC